MSDPVVALLLVISLFIAIAVVRFFKTLDGDFWRAAASPIFAGLAAGVLIRLLDPSTTLRPIAIGVVVTIAALYSRLTGE